MPEDSERNIQDEVAMEVNGSEASHSMNAFEPLPELHTPHKRRRLILWAGIVLAILDLCCLPITYYYALKFDTSLSLQDGREHLLHMVNSKLMNDQYSLS